MSGSCHCYQQEAVFLSLGYNLVEAEATCVFTTTGDLTGAAPLLVPLGDYGGDTLAHQLLIGSPAIDQGSCHDSPTDQRGFPRPIDCMDIPNADDGCDIGAFESPRAFSTGTSFLQSTWWAGRPNVALLSESPTTGRFCDVNLARVHQPPDQFSDQEPADLTPNGSDTFIRLWPVGGKQARPATRRPAVPA